MNEFSSYVAFPSLRKTQDKVNCRLACTTLRVTGLNLSFIVCCVGTMVANCFMLIWAVASTFLLPPFATLFI